MRKPSTHPAARDLDRRDGAVRPRTTVRAVPIELYKAIPMMTSHCDRSCLTVFQTRLWYNISRKIILFFE
jgi:hypothetical protein